MEDSSEKYDWSDLKIVEKVIREYFQEFHHFPSAGEMRQYLPKGIVDGIYRYHGGVDCVRKKLQYDSSLRKPSNYWKDWENIKKEVLILYKELNNYPKQIDFKRYKLTSLDNAIRLYHGGHKEVAKKLQLEVRQWIIAKDGHSCNSYFEKMLDDALFELKVIHDREVVFKLERKLKIDFKIGNKYIEVLMFNINTAPKTEMEKQYKSNYLEKRKLFIELGLDVFEWYPEYFYQFQNYLDKLLSFFGQNFTTIA